MLVDRWKARKWTYCAGWKVVERCLGSGSSEYEGRESEGENIGEHRAGRRIVDESIGLV